MNRVDSSAQLIVLDASTIINFLLVRAWPSLLRTRSFQLASPRTVLKQIRKDRRVTAIRSAIREGTLREVDEPIPEHLLSAFPEWVRRFGEQDAAVLVNVIALDAWMGADDRALCNEAQRLGIVQIVGTEWLFAELVRQGHISLQRGNGKLRELSRNRYVPKEPCLCSMVGEACNCKIG